MKWLNLAPNTFFIRHLCHLLSQLVDLTISHVFAGISGFQALFFKRDITGLHHVVLDKYRFDGHPAGTSIVSIKCDTVFNLIEAPLTGKNNLCCARWLHSSNFQNWNVNWDQGHPTINIEFHFCSHVKKSSEIYTLTLSIPWGLVQPPSQISTPPYFGSL